MNIDPGLIEAIRQWALNNPDVRRCWLFGSRVKGSARPDSDLDIAVQPTAEPYPRRWRDQWLTGDEYIRVSFHEMPRWRDQLAEVVPYTVHLELYEAPPLGSIVYNAIAKGPALLVFDRDNVE